MGSKKRKESSGSTEEPTKKNKKSKSGDKEKINKPEADKTSVTVPNPDKILHVPSDPNPEPTPSDDAAAIKSKKSHKRAADFMEDEAVDSDGGVKIPQSEPVEPTEEPAKKKAKKANKAKKTKDGESLTADGVNGVIEHTGDEELETATTQKPASTSLQAEAERTVDHELKDGFGGFASEDEEEDGKTVEVDDNAAALLAGFDSDTEDVEDEGLDLSKVLDLPKSKKLPKKLEKAKAKGNNEGPGTVYVGRIPHGFYEKEMRAYFSQFGDITRLRLSRNRRTGASKHFAFIEFSHNSVAKIAAEAMDNYLMFGHILKCKYAEPGSLHPDVWEGANKKFRKIPHEKLEREQLATPKTEQRWQKKVDKEQKKREKKAEQMKLVGLDMPASVLTSPSAVLKQRLTDKEEVRQIEEAETTQTGAIEPPPDVPKDEVAVKASKKSKKENKDKKGKKDDLEDTANSKQIIDSSEALIEKASTRDATGEETKVQHVEDDSSLPTAETVKEVDTSPPKKKKLTKSEKKILHAEKKAEKQAKRAAEKSEKTSQLPAVDVAADEAPKEPAAATAPVDTKAELSADFISLGQSNDAPNQSSGGGRKVKPWKVKKPKKERKNLVKARGPKSKLVSTKPKRDPNAQGKIPGLPLMGKGKYDKATRQAHKELKKKIIAERAARGLPPYRVRGEWAGTSGQEPQGQKTTPSHARPRPGRPQSSQTTKKKQAKKDRSVNTTPLGKRSTETK